MGVKVRERCRTASGVTCSGDTSSARRKRNNPQFNLPPRFPDRVPRYTLGVNPILRRGTVWKRYR
jgi:hypothetical protein